MALKLILWFARFLEVKLRLNNIRFLSRLFKLPSSLFHMDSPDNALAVGSISLLYIPNTGGVPSSGAIHCNMGCEGQEFLVSLVSLFLLMIIFIDEDAEDVSSELKKPLE